MDPLTQGVIGATLPQACTTVRGRQFAAGALGFLSGMAADLDVFIRSDTDPLLFLEYHRQFTHSLVFIPVGGLLCGAILYWLLGRRWSLRFASCWLYCTLGYATHAVLDACTTYGTLLLWPFSDQRFAWNVISIIDPLYTLPLLALVVLSARRGTPWFARLALAWALTYPLLGLVQRERAEAAGLALAHARGHQPLQLEAKPGFANLVLWKVVYETADRYYVDAAHVLASPHMHAGSHVEKLDISRDLPWLDPDSQQARDLERFRWFSNGYIARDPNNRYRVIDIRYSMIPNEINALWSIELSPAAGRSDHVAWRTHRDGSRERLANMLELLMN